jgi:tyrosinase
MGRGAGGIVRRPAVPPPIRIRRNVLSLRADDPIVVFYGRAIDRMKTRRISAFNSWRYQAAIHDYIRADDPNAVPGDLPLPADSTTFWSTCEHRNWWFLPWHRMYLHHFEMMVLHEVLDLGGPTDWALPYWNYSAGDANARLLPEAFRQGALFVRNRDANANAGLPFMRTGTADPTDISSLRETVFEGTAPEASAGVGGLRRGPHEHAATRDAHGSPVGLAAGTCGIAPSGGDGPVAVRVPRRAPVHSQRQDRSRAPSRVH